MLDIAERNISEWFDNTIRFESHVRDFGHERFDDLFATDNAGNNDDVPINLVLLLGGTLCNLRSPDQALQAINDSLGLNDLIIYSTKLDTANSRRYFDFNISHENQELTPRHRLTLDMLDLDPSLYEVEQFYDSSKKARFIGIKLKVAVSIEFNLEHGVRHIEFNKDDSILLWRYWHLSAIDIIDQFDRNDFDLQIARKSENQEYLLLLSRIKRSE
jgi:hypothetical protein